MNPPFPFRHGKYAVVHNSPPFATTSIPHASGVNSTVVRAKLKPSVWTSLADAAPPNSTTDHFAIKISKPNRLREAFHEREFLSALKEHDVCHRHILSCYTCFAYDAKLHFVMDLAIGHLDNFMATRLSAEMNVPTLNSPLKWLLTQFHGLTEALNCIHKPGITLMGWHHDIKPENILFFETEGHGIEFRIADWTTAEICSYNPYMVGLEQSEPPGSTQVGWPAYLPFETLVGKTGCAPDVWSLGCVFLEMLVWFEKGLASVPISVSASSPVPFRGPASLPTSSTPEIPIVTLFQGWKHLSEMSKGKITLFVDIVSPFAYIAFHALQNQAVFKQCEITYVPVFLGGIMNACGNTPPIKIKNKDKYIDLERRRWAAFLNVPISDGAPANFPANTLSTGRILTAISVSHPQSLPAALALFWQNYWVAGIDPTTPDAALAIVTAVLGKEEALKIMEASKSGEIKGKLMKTTEWAINEGAFGVPWFIVTNAEGKTEKYWGIDHLGQVCNHLGLERPGTPGFKALL
ncbi:hypothetical protein GRF29_1536g926088 [Pseudopithomyces chartarum]|uniref:Glutathione S-transferase kappa 1 n=1 Tax=Pseudopithomyces chartarum TaxID=1892770 RepID=A0AAN6LQK3_9PLEO|nr:hypothetical protein GRF29_1536g926088 [Pseudopithomyces chartarum]